MVKSFFYIFVRFVTERIINFTQFENFKSIQEPH